ncbi:hypothetical protein [Paenibacillus sp. R14(2021)]|uniref:hypothetical protein n=1 Tax=Paenibacillus sp. R14(2021) TaxID=2859228 RepID=UPI001C611A95|nr:hypothetical protein [Paenibacillus sp. R14(2021)]
MTVVVRLMLLSGFTDKANYYGGITKQIFPNTRKGDLSVYYSNNCAATAFNGEDARHMEGSF